MKKCLCIGLVLSFLMMFSVSGQSHISKEFDLDMEWTLKRFPEQFRQQGLVGCVNENIFFCCHRRGFQSKENGFRAAVYTVNLQTGQEGIALLSIPERKVNAAVARKYWIRGIAVEENQLFLLVQDAVLLYREGKGGRYEFVKRFSVDLPECVAIQGGQLSFVERVPEIGTFVLKRQKGQSEMLDTVTMLPLPGPFMLQYEPNGFIKSAGGNLYFLASPELRIGKYSFDGDLLAEIHPELPGWRGIPDELARKISEMPYGSDRAMYTFSHTKHNSFPMEITPLRDTVLLLSYHHYDTLEKQEKVLTALVVYDERGEVQRVESFTHFFDRDSVIGCNCFPLYYAQRELCLQVADGDRLVQIVREAPVEWRGRTGRDYYDSVDRYFVDGLPEIRMRVAKLHLGDAERRCHIDSLGLQTYEGTAFTGKALASSKMVFIVNNPPQCHSCEETLFSFMNTIDTSVCKVCIVFNDSDGYLAKRDQIENVGRHLAIPFVPLFVPTEAKASFLKQLEVSSFPVVMTKEQDDARVVIVPNGQIYAENQTGNLKEDFVRKITRFLNRKGGGRE